MADFFSLDDLKGWLGIVLTDTTRDDLLTGLVSAASEACVKVMGRDPTRRTRTETVDGYGGAALPVNHYPIQSVASVTICPETGAQPLPADQYYFDDNLIYLRRSKFPLGKRNVALVYTAGLASVPPTITLAAKYTAKAMWDARLTDMNSTGESFSAIGGGSFWPTGPGSVPPQAVSLLMAFYNPVKV